MRVRTAAPRASRREATARVLERARRTVATLRERAAPDRLAFCRGYCPKLKNTVEISFVLNFVFALKWYPLFGLMKKKNLQWSVDVGPKSNLKAKVYKFL